MLQESAAGPTDQNHLGRRILHKNRIGLKRHIAGEKRDLCELSLRNQAAIQAGAETRTRAEAQASAIEAFSRIRALVRGTNPLRLLSRICVECSFREASAAGAAESYASEWGSWSGIVARLVCSGDCGSSSPADATRQTIDALSSEFVVYWKGVTGPDPTRDTPSHDDVVGRLAEECRMHAAMVKHDAQPYQFREAAERLYRPEDEWLKNKFGFTVEEALATMDGISDTVQLHIQRGVDAVAQGLTPAMIREARFHDVMLQALDSDPDMAVLTEDEIAAASSIPHEACAAVLRRFSQHVEERPREDSSGMLLDPLQLPFEFDETFARPLIEIHGKYVCPQLILLDEAIFLSLSYDLMDNKSVQDAYSHDRGAWLEQAVADYLKGVFGPDAVCANPYRDDKNELCDVLVYYDNIVIVVSCKAKMLTRSAEYGNDAAKLKEDLQKGIGDSHNQVQGALAYLRSSEAVNVFRPDGNLWTTVKSVELDAVVPVYVLPSSYQSLPVGEKDIVSGLGLQVDVDTLPWIVSVFDLENVAEILNESPAVFLHYITRRRDMAQASADVGADEMDLLGAYLDHGLYFGRGSDYLSYDGVTFFGFSAEIDAYLGTVHELGMDTQKPRSGAPFVLSGLVAEIAHTRAAHRTVSLLRLLDLDGTDQTTFLNHITSCREKTLGTSAPCCYTVAVKRGLTMSMITYFAGTGGTPAAVKQARDWARGRLEPHRHGTWEWGCLIGDVTSKDRVQSVIYAPPHESRERPL